MRRLGAGRLSYIISSLALIVCLGAGCEKARHFRDHKTVLQRVRAQGKATKVSPKAFRIHKGLAPRDAVHVSFLGRRFVTPRRSDAIPRYPCSGCHTAPVPKRKGNAPSHAYLATHGKIQIKHAAPGTLRCSSCHESKAMQWLKTPAGQRVSFNQSHKLCASCHQRQAKDWAGGAHGKRIGRWYGQRAIYTCTQCHNPHTALSRFGKRWPKAYFTLPTQLPRKRLGKRKGTR